MIRVGVDLVDISRFERALRTWPRLRDRLFTKRELDYASSRVQPAQHLAARVAAKEAVFKALGEGWPKVAWTDVEVQRDDNRPSLVLSGRALQLAGSSTAALSLSHDGGFALAQVVLFDG